MVNPKESIPARTFLLLPSFCPLRVIPFFHDHQFSSLSPWIRLLVLLLSQCFCLLSFSFISFHFKMCHDSFIHLLIQLPIIQPLICARRHRFTAHVFCLSCPRAHSFIIDHPCNYFLCPFSKGIMPLLVWFYNLPCSFSSLFLLCNNPNILSATFDLPNSTDDIIILYYWVILCPSLLVRIKISQ